MVKKGLFFAAILVFCMLSAAAGAESQDLKALNYNIEFNIIDKNVLATYSATFIETSSGSFSLNLPKDAESIEVYADGRAISPVIMEKENSKEVKLIFSDARNVKINFQANDFLEKASKSYFVADLNMPFDSEELKVKLILPEQAVLDRTDSAFPEPASISSDGQRIIINWLKNDLEKGGDFSIFVIFRGSADFGNTFLIIGIIAAAALIVFSAMKFIRKAKNLDYLIQNEKAVLDVLKKEKGESWQKNIQLKTGFSKAKLSRTIRDLEVRGLITRIPIGNTNKIRLK